MTAKQRRVVVVGIDGSDHSLVALRRAAEEARLRQAETHVVHVADVSPAVLHLPGDVTIDTADLAASQRKAVWEKAEPVLSAFEVTSKQVDLEGYPADALVDYCDQTNADLLVLGTRGRGRLSSTFLGSTSLRALERAHCDVLIAKG
ncbi:MAG TPA: universal stress protein [Acidimicrobiia bacterium]